MSVGGSLQTEVTFQDASSYFSEEDWSPLQEWQKELYRNVMKEIHQALISLGPLIATTVWSLRTKVKEELCPSDDQCSDRRPRIKVPPNDAVADPDEVFRENIAESMRLKNPQGSGKRGKTDRRRTKKEEGYPLPKADISLHKEEPVSIFIDHLGAEIEENRIDTNPGDESTKRKRNIEDSVKYSERALKRKGLSREITTTDLQVSNEEANSRIDMWSQCFQDLRGEKTGQYKSSFNNPSPLSSPRGSPSIEGSDKYDEFESNLPYSQFTEDHPNTPQNQKPNTCSEGDKSYRVRPYACTECEKSFFHKSHLIMHNRIHSGEKPFVCPFCHKGFNRKDYLGEHIRTHTGERPYKCTNCEKRFIQKSHLNEHQRKQACTKTAKTAT
ncbi:zinc finger protein 713-like isoform X2 [Pleurodeles waltl]|uniref:zinc finger protein 713-like isoform X2 n=1 Tax=Pleurodeles waltl TaxID=8319 RepID=UPI0037093C0A